MVLPNKNVSNNNIFFYVISLILHLLPDVLILPSQILSQDKITC
jgi:hypothetical protein